MHNRRPFNWDDLRYFLALAEHGSTIAAARVLGVNQSTVHRRIAEFEARIGHKIAERGPTGYQLTPFGSRLLDAATAVQTSVNELQAKIEDYENDLSGTLRLTCPEPIMERIVASGLLDRLHDRHPGLHVEFLMSDGYLDIAKGEADVALRSGEPEDETLVGRKISTSVWAVYASQNYIQQHGRPQDIADLANHSLIGFDGTLAKHRAAKWLASTLPLSRITATSNSVLGILHAVKSGIGVAPLPTTIADADDTLVQVLPPIQELTRGWYILTSPDKRHTPRIAAFLEFMETERAALRTILMG